ncbi:MAG: 6-bladed beta-propeller [Balneola sp.]
MIKWILRSLAIILTVVFLVLLFNKITGNQEAEFLKLNTGIEPQFIENVTERTWLDYELEKVPLENDLSDSLFNPMLVKNFNDTLYVVDYADMKIKRFTKNGKFINQYGKNIGRGPEDFNQITDISITDEKIYAVDANTFKTKVLSKQTGEAYKPISYKHHVSRVLALPKHSTITLGISTNLFRLYDANDSLRMEFGELTNDQMKNMLSFGGILLESSNPSEFMYLSSYASFIFFYNTKGENTKTFQTIDRLDFPKSTVSETGVRAPSPPLMLQGAALNNEHLFLQYTRKSMKDHENPLFHQMHSFIDVYSDDGKSYFGSFTLTQRTRGITVINDALYAINYNTSKVEGFKLLRF